MHRDTAKLQFRPPGLEYGKWASGRCQPAGHLQFVNDSIGNIPVILLEFSMSPLGKGESVSPYVARSLEIVEQSGLDYRLHAMGTVIEGEWDEVFDLVRQCYEALRDDCDRITCSIKVDYRKGAAGRLSSKVRSVEEKLGHQLKSTESSREAGAPRNSGAGE